MSKLERLTAKIFADNAPTGKIGQFGSALAGTKIETSNVEEIQALPAYTEGWSSAVISSKNYPTLEEMNGVMKVMSYQTAYTLQNGIPEYDVNTEYQTGSICKGVGNTSQYASLTNDNIGNNVTNSNYWKNVTPVNYSNITNCITEIPQRIKLELKNGVLTLKAGSEVIVPNGLESDGTTPKFDYVTIESDISTSTVSPTSAQRFWLVNLDAMNFVDGTTQYTFSGNTSVMNSTTANAYSNFYNTETNMFYRGNGSSWGIRNWSLPIALITNEPSVISSIDQVFNGFGYIGSTYWVDKGVKGLIANGRNEDITLKNIEWNNNKLMTYTFASNLNTPRHMAYSFNGNVLDYMIFNSTNWSFNDETNFFEFRGSPAIWLDLGTCNLTNGVISNFNPKQPFRAVDSNEFVEIEADFLAPDYTAGVSVSSGYTATKNGWLYIYHKNTNDGQSIAVSVAGTVVFESGDSGTWSTNLVASGFIFVGNGQQITYTGTGTNTLKFYPCKGGN